MAAGREEVATRSEVGAFAAGDGDGFVGVRAGERWAVVAAEKEGVEVAHFGRSVGDRREDVVLEVFMPCERDGSKGRSGAALRYSVEKMCGYANACGIFANPYRAVEERRTES